MPTTVMLIRWHDAWTEYVDAAGVALHGRKEAFLSAGAAQTAAEAQAIGAAQLAELNRVREKVTVETDPDDAAWPYLTYRPRDVIPIADSNLVQVATRINAVSMAEDDDGKVAWVPEGGDLLPPADERFATTLKKMANGTVGGSAPGATPKTGNVAT